MFTNMQTHMFLGATVPRCNAEDMLCHDWIPTLTTWTRCLDHYGPYAGFAVTDAAGRLHTLSSGTRVHRFLVPRRNPFLNVNHWVMIKHPLGVTARTHLRFSHPGAGQPYRRGYFRPHRCFSGKLPQPPPCSRAYVILMGWNYFAMVTECHVSCSIMPKHPYYTVNHCYRDAITLIVYTMHVVSTADRRCVRDLSCHGVGLSLVSSCTNCCLVNEVTSFREYHASNFAVPPNIGCC